MSSPEVGSATVPERLHALWPEREADRELMELVYRRALFLNTDRPYYRQRQGRYVASEWALDLRRPLTQSSILQPVALSMNRLLAGLGVRQIAGRGYGAFALVGAMLALGRDLTGVLVREQRKAHGFRETLEGTADRSRPVAVVDDLLSSGTSAVKTADMLRADGLWPTVVVTVFRYEWCDGRGLLRHRGLEHRALAALRLAGSGPGSDASAVAAGGSAGGSLGTGARE